MTTRTVIVLELNLHTAALAKVCLRDRADTAPPTKLAEDFANAAAEFEAAFNAARLETREDA